MGLLETEVIRRSIGDVENRRTTAQQAVIQATAALEALDRELALLKELVRIRDGGGIAIRNGATSAPGTYGSTSAARIGSDASRVVDEVAAILRDAGQPLPIRVIYDQLQSRGVPLPGQGRMVNVIAAVTRSKAISRPARGVYALSEWAGTAVETNATLSSHAKRAKRGRRRPRTRVKA